MYDKHYFNVILNGEFNKIENGLMGFHAVRFCEAESPEKASEICKNFVFKQIKDSEFLNSIDYISIKIDEVIEIDSDNSDEEYNWSFIYYQEQ